MIFCDLCLRDIANHPFIIPFSCFTLNFKLHYDWHGDHNKLISISDNSPSFLIHGVSFVVEKHNEMFTTTIASTLATITTTTTVTIDWITQRQYKVNKGVGGKDERKNNVFGETMMTTTISGK